METTQDPPVDIAQKIADLPTMGEKLTHLILLDPDRTEVLVLWFFLAVLLVGIVWILRAWDRDETNNILISDLVCVDGRISESKLARFGAFVISSWAFVFLIVTGKMTEWFFFGYMAAWVSNAIFSKYIDKKMPEHAADFDAEAAPADNDEAEPEPDLKPARAVRRRR